MYIFFQLQYGFKRTLCIALSLEFCYNVKLLNILVFKKPKIILKCSSSFIYSTERQKSIYNERYK